MSAFPSILLRMGLTAALLMCLGLTSAQAEVRPVVAQESFEKGADAWEPTDAKAWKLEKSEQGQVFSQFQQSKYKPPHRSPLNIALLKDVYVGDFTLTLKLKSTARDYDHRSLCLFFGHQDPSHFYYVHLGKKADAHANQIFIVNDAPRIKISRKENPGTPWDDAWHNVKIVRNVDSGLIQVYFDDMETPVLDAVDKNFTWGRIGIGSFDDTGWFDDLTLRGVKVDRPSK